MNAVIDWLSNITVEEIVSWISSLGMIIAAITGIIVSVKAKIKTGENVDIQSEVDRRCNQFKAEMLRQMQEMTQETVNQVSKSNQHVIEMVSEKQRKTQEETQKQIEAASLKVNQEIALLKEIKTEV